MRTCEEIRAFLVAVEDARHDLAIAATNHIRELPERLQSGLARAIKSVIEPRYEREELQYAVAVVPSAHEYPGALAEAVQTLTREVTMASLSASDLLRCLCHNLWVAGFSEGQSRLARNRIFECFNELAIGERGVLDLRRIINECLEAVIGIVEPHLRLGLGYL
jgi:hypothetical protein